MLLTHRKLLQARSFGADSEEKREPVSDIDTAVVDSLEALDPDRPIREADMASVLPNVRLYPAKADITEN
jgi:hypothetical protein